MIQLSQELLVTACGFLLLGALAQCLAAYFGYVADSEARRQHLALADAVESLTTKLEPPSAPPPPAQSDLDTWRSRAAGFELASTLVGWTCVITGAAIALLSAVTATHLS